MAYDRYDTRRGRDFNDDRDRREERGFFERAGDEIASWFGDEDSDRLRGSGRDWDRERFDEDNRSGPTNRMSSDRGSRPRSGSERGYSGGGFGRFESDSDRRSFDRDFERSRGPRSRDDYRRPSGTATGRDHDRHYDAWRQRQLDELDRDYEDYRREHQQRFESDFGSWRQTRQQKRGLLSSIREHMEVVGSDGETVGKVDCVRGDHIVLTKSDSDDNRHHSIKCSMVDAVDADQVKLEVPAEEAKSRFKEGGGERGLFGRDEEGEVNLERSFSGTYR